MDIGLVMDFKTEYGVRARRKRISRTLSPKHPDRRIVRRLRRLGRGGSSRCRRLRRGKRVGRRLRRG